MIPITFNHDDLNNEKKGNIRAQDLASYLSISMPRRAGVLDVFDNPCTIDLNATQMSTGYATITMHKGYVNIYGRCVYVEEGEQVRINLPTDTSSVRGIFGIRINLAETGANEVTWFTKTTTLRQDNILNNELTGVYEFGLYSYEATASTINFSLIAPKIENIADFLKGANFQTNDVDTNNKTLATAEYVKANIEKYVPKVINLDFTANVTGGDANNIFGNGVQFTGTGVLYRNTNGKRYIVANLVSTFRVTQTLQKISSIKILNINSNGFVFKAMEHGGILGARQSQYSYNGVADEAGNLGADGCPQFWAITDFSLIGNTDGLGYRSNNSTYGSRLIGGGIYNEGVSTSYVRQNNYLTLTITNAIMEVE